MDFMSRIWSSDIPPECKTIGDMITWALSICKKDNTRIVHIVGDSYLERSTKSCERLTRADGIELIKYGEGEITADLPLIDDMKRFWAYSPNKFQLQNHICAQIVSQDFLDKDVIVSGLSLMMVSPTRNTLKPSAILPRLLLQLPSKN